MKGACAVVLFSLIAAACAYPRGEPPAAAQPAPLSEMIEQAKAGITNLSQEISKRLETDGQTALETIKAQSSTFTANVQEFITKASEDVKAKSPELQKAWEEMKARFDGVINDVNAQIPDAQEHAKELAAKLTNGLNVVIEETNKAAKEISKNSEKVQEDFAKFTKEAVDVAVKTAQNLDTQLRQLAVTQAPKA